MDEKRKNEIISFLIFGISILFLFSLFFSLIFPQTILLESSYFKWLQKYLSPIKNTMGPVGYGIAFILRFCFGYTSFIIPFIFIWLGFYKIKGEKLLFKIIGISLFTIILSSLLTLFGNSENQWNRLIQGGYLGNWLIQNFWWNFFGKIGSYIVISLLFILSFLLSTKFLFSTFFTNLNKFKNIFSKLISQKEKKPKTDSFIPPIIKTNNHQIEQIQPNIKIINNNKTEKNKIKKEIEENLFSNNKKDFIFPSLSLLTNPKLYPGETEEELLNNSKLLVETFRNFGLETRIEAVNRGPVVTRYEIQLASGIKVNKITALDNDIALAFAAPHVRIEAPVPGKSVIGIEIPNKKKDIVFLKEILTSDSFQNSSSCLTVTLGKDIAGTAIVMDLKKAPHLLIAGATGAGKSVCINSIILSTLFKATPDEVKFVMIDPKRVELSLYDDIPHLLFPVVKDSKKAAKILEFCVIEMENRYKLLAEQGVRNIESYNKNIQKNEENSFLPYIVIVIDELADLMITSPKEVEERICRLAQMARGVGMHLVLATQRPSVNVITGLIKANIPSRISFAVSSQIDSRTILDMNGAETLLGAGDMLYSPVGSMKPTRAQGTFVSEEEVKKIVHHLKQIKTPQYLWQEEEVNKLIEIKSKTKDILYDEAVKLVVENKEASVTWLQRKLGLGYARAAKLIDEMEQNGIVSAQNASKQREVLVEKDYLFTEKGLDDI
ncbi:MAG: DNA translocase FtsK 4TM domain-containing protein [bacterium]